MNYSSTVRKTLNQYNQLDDIVSFIPRQQFNLKPTSSNNSKRVYLCEIDDKLHFKYPQTYYWDLIDGYYDIQVPYLCLEVMEKTRVALMESLREEFKFLWDNYAKENDLNLTKGARRIKRWLLSNVIES